MTNGLSRWTIALYLAAIFGAGAVSGWVVAARTAKKEMFSPPRPAEFAASMRERYQSRLKLSPDQANKLAAIVEESVKEMQSIHADSFKRVRQGISNRNAQITAILTPEQKKEFDLMEKEWSDKWRGRDGGRGKDSWRGGKDGGHDRDGGRDWKRAPRERGGTNLPASTNGGPC